MPHCTALQELLVYAPDSEQPRLDRKPEELGEQEREMFTFLQSDDCLDKLVTFLSLEENKVRKKNTGI